MKAFMAEAKKIVRKVAKDLGYTIYDFATDDDFNPHLRFGHCTESRYANKTDRMKELTLTLNIWSDQKGSRELMEIISNIENGLNNYIHEDDSNYILVELKTGMIEVIEEYEKASGTNKKISFHHGIMPIQIKLMEVK